MFGSLIFLCSDKDAEHIQHIIETDASFIEDHTIEAVGPFKFSLEEDGFLYRVRFSDDQWLNVIDMGKILEDASIEADIVHAVSDDTYVDVVSTSGYYDQFTEDSSEMVKMFDTFGFDVDEDIDLYGE
ncbi:hypothetical protein NVP2275O_009 [Vibrio phage 2.275.O._10N.286.54.E11]|nr:hypothetical protein NVP2275O_009 [Vibrio phage 2.275.O._10N.286.54.E11]